MRGLRSPVDSLSSDQIDELVQDSLVHFLSAKTLDKCTFDLRFGCIFFDIKGVVLCQRSGRHGEVGMISRISDRKCTFLPPDSMDAIMIIIPSTIVAGNETVSITTFENTDTNKVSILKFILEMSQEDISNLIPITIQRISGSKFTVTENAIVVADLTNAQIRFILSVAEQSCDTSEEVLHHQ
jgi:hypothetical protein